MHAHQNRERLEKAAIERAWQLGDLRYKLHPAQREMHKVITQTDSLKVVLNCSRRIGKTFTLALAATELCLKMPNARVRFACPTQVQLKKILRDSFSNLLKDAPDKYKPQFKTADKVWVFHNGSELHLSGCNNQHYENLRGVSADLFILDEAGFVDELDYIVEDVAMPQLLSTEGRLILASTPPRSPSHPFREYALNAEAEGAYSKFTIHQSHYDKKRIERFLKESGGADSTTWQREYLAEFVVDSDSSIIPEWKDAYIGEAETRDTRYPLWHKYVGLDIGVRDLTVALFGHYNFEKATLYVEDEWSLHGPEVTTAKIAAFTRAKEIELWGPGLKRPYRRIADNNNLVLINDLSLLHDVAFMPTNKEALEAMVNQVRMWVNSGRIIVHPRCKQLLGCLSNGIWDTNRKEFDRVEAYGHFDALAALVYLVRNIDTASNPIPRTHGHDLREVFHNSKPHLSDSAETVKAAFNWDFKLFKRK